jgi:hypothetical protein
MKKMTRTYKKEDAMLREKTPSTLEKQQAKRQKDKPAPEMEAGKGNILIEKENKRAKRREMLDKAMSAAMKKEGKDPY